MATCPHCGYDSEISADACPLCGADLASSEADGTGSGEGSPRGAGAAARPPSWEREDASFPEDLLSAWKESLFAPAEFFGSLGPGRGLWRALLYFLIFSLLGASFSLVWNLSMGPVGPEGVLRSWGLGRTQFAALGFLMAPFAALFGLLVSTVVLHVMAVMLVPDHQRMGETARVLCYAQSGPQLFQAVPWLGSLVALVWSVVLVVVGLREVHRTSTLRAAAIVLLPVFLLMVVLVVLFAAMAAMVGPEVPSIPLP